MAVKFLIDDVLLKEAHLYKKNVVCFDTETTGLTNEDEIIQFSAATFDGETFEILDTCSFYINIGKKLPKNIINITGITDEKLETEGISRRDSYNKIKNFLSDKIILGYNVSFDIKKVNHLYNMFQDEFNPSHVIDTYKLVKKYSPKGETVNQKLGTMTSYFKCEDGLSFHNAIDDVIATIRVTKALLDQRINNSAFKIGDIPLNNYEPPKKVEVPFLPMFPEKEKESKKIRCKILRMDRWKQSQYMDRVYIALMLETGKRGKIFFDNNKGCFSEPKEGTLLDSINLYDVQVQAFDILFNKGYYSFSDFE